MLLTVSERLNLLTILPKEGNFVTLKIVRQLREALSFSEEDYEKFKITGPGQEYIDEQGLKTIVPDGQLRFKNEVAEISIGKKAIEIITEKLKTMDSQGKIPESMYSLCEKFLTDD